MKKFALVIVFAAATFAIAGVHAQQNWWYITNEEGGGSARNNQVTLRRGDNYVYIYFRNNMPGAEFDKIQLDFTISTPLAVTWQAAYNDGQVWGSEVLIGTIDKGPIETDLASFTKNWFGGGRALSKRGLRGVCLKIVVPSGSATFTMTDVAFIGLQ